MKILQLGNPILEKKSEKVKDLKSEDVQNLIDDMLDTVISHEDHAAGLSAPQVGQLKRITLVKRYDKLENEDDANTDIGWEIMVNPEISDSSENRSVVWEGCLSVREGDLFGEVERPAEIQVNYLNRHGEKKSLRAKGFFSHLIQHEIDHLNGILFLKYVPDPTQLYTGKELDRILTKEIDTHTA